MELEKVQKSMAEAPGNFHEKVQFPNGRGVSIIRNEWSYGHEQGLFEVAVLDANGDIDYSTPIHNEVVGWLDVQGVLGIMKEVSELPAILTT